LQQHVDQDESKSGHVPRVAAIEVTEVELRPILATDQLGQLPCVGSLGEDRGHPVRETNHAQYIVYVGRVLKRRDLVERHDVAPPQVFKDRREVSRTLALEETHLENA